MKHIGLIIKENMKIESVVFVITLLFSGILLLNMDPFTQAFTDTIKVYFNGARIDGITAFFTITVGIYLAVITIIATSVIGISKKLLSSKIDQALLVVFISGMVEDLLVIMTAVIVPSTFSCYYSLLIGFSLMAFISFVKFIWYISKIFHANLNEMAKNLDEESRYKDNILEQLTRISENTKRH